jgi:hypothetical protein
MISIESPGRIDDLRANRLSDYDFCHSRLTYLGTKTDNLSGFMHLAGHRQPATTARYLRPQLTAAEEVLAAAERVSAATSTPVATAPMTAAETEEFWLQSGCTDQNAGAAKVESEGEIGSDFEPVRGGGIEPPWLLTASTSS